MFINKINSVSNVGFKGYNHVKNNVGETVMKFNYPYNDKEEDCEIQFFRATPNDKYNYLIDEKPIYTVALKPEGVNVNLQDVTNLDKDEAFAYRIVRKNKKDGSVIWTGADTGTKLIRIDGNEYGFRLYQDVNWNNQDKGVPGHYSLAGPKVSEYAYSLVTRKGPTPTVQGSAYLAIPDSFYPGWKYRGFDDKNTGEIYYDKDYQKAMEGVKRNFSNKFGGGLAGLQAGIPYLKKNGYKLIFTTPTANGDNRSSHGYWNKNNFWVSPEMGNIENYKNLLKEFYKNGMAYVYDGTFTSEGLEGIHFAYALRWGSQNPQTYYWFRMSGLKNSNLTLGTIPKNKENLRHKLINAPFKYELQENGTYKAVPKKYDPNKETLIQIYDASQATEEQINAEDKLVKYDKLKSENELDKVTHDDTLINYVYTINPKDYQKRIDAINNLNKKQGKNIRLDSADGTIMASQFPFFEHGKKTEGGFVAWDANTDMAKLNYHISGYDEKILQAIPNLAQREHEREMIIRGTKEVQDITLQAIKYLIQTGKDVQTMYTAQTVGSAKTIEALNKLIEDGKLPEETRINSYMLNNILNGQYILSPKGVLSKDDVTVKALMKLPLDALEVGENTVGVLSTSYFSNRATTDETIGISRFDLMKDNNPHLVEPYAKTYKRVNSLYQNEIKDFADTVIKKVNETTNEKLLDKNGDYTEYGEYVVDLIGQDIAKYAFLKALTGDQLKTKILQTGEVTYDYDKLRDLTSLKALGINAHSPESEAEMLEKKIEKGMKNLSDSDVSYLANSISKRIAGTDTASFRIAEALFDKAGLGLKMRLDAAKDVMDMDSIRNEDGDFDDIMTDFMKFWAKGSSAIKSIDPNSSLIAEITDIDPLMKDKYGEDSCPYNGDTNIGSKFNGVPDFMTKLFNETGITTEAGYSYFFTNLLHSFARDFEAAGLEGTEYDGYTFLRHDTFKDKVDLLLETRTPDFLRNMYTFMGNHDKPRMIHCLALDMSMFHNAGFPQEKRQHRLEALSILSGAKSINDMPIEFRLNADNKDYMRTISLKAAAKSKLLKQVVNEDLKGVATEEDIKNLNQAIIDLTNGNYLNDNKNINYQTINIKELSTLKDAFSTILNMAEKRGLHITETEKENLIKQVVDNANKKDLSNYQVHGDFDWTSLSDEEKNANYQYGKELLGSRSDYNKYSLYTVQLARLLKDSYTGDNSAIKSAFTDFVEKYDKKAVSEHTTELPKSEDSKISKAKNGYAAMDIKASAEMLVKQVEYKTGKPVANREAIIDTIYKAATEPAEAKASMIMEYLGALFGTPQMYAGDELGMTGYEEKAKNIYLQNRNALPWTETEGDNLIGGYRRAVMKSMNEALSNRSKPELTPLNDGTPYSMDVKIHGMDRNQVRQRIIDITAELKNPDVPNRTELEQERRELTKDLAKVAYMMQNADGDITVSVFYAGDIDHENKVDYFAKYGLTDKNGAVDEAKRKEFFEKNHIESINPHNRYVPIQEKTEIDSITCPIDAVTGAAAVALPVGAVFMNANIKDKTKYIVNKAGEIVREDGKKIILDGLTTRNGVMVLRKLKSIAFKGKSHILNTQYNIGVSNTYQKAETAEEGKKLSIIAR